MLINILFWLLKAAWWLFVSSGFAAVMFCFAGLCGYTAGVFKTKYPESKPRYTTSRTELILWVILFALIGSIPVVNWILAVSIYKCDADLVSSMIRSLEQEYGLPED